MTTGTAPKLATTDRFYLFVANQQMALFTEISGLQIETETEEYAEGGNNGFVHKMPGRTRVGNITLRYGMTASAGKLFNWYLDVINGAAGFRRNISIVLYHPDGTEMRRWNFINAYPIKWVGPQLASENGSTALEEIELAHEGMQFTAVTTT